MNRVRYMCLLYFINEFAIRKYCTISRGEVRLQGVVLCQIAEFCTKARQLRLARAHRKYWHHITLQNHEMLQFYQSKEIILDLECRGITFPVPLSSLCIFICLWNGNQGFCLRIFTFLSTVWTPFFSQMTIWLVGIIWWMPNTQILNTLIVDLTQFYCFLKLWLVCWYDLNKQKEVSENLFNH